MIDKEDMQFVAEIMKKVKRKRPIQNQRLDSFSWWLDVEFAFRNAILETLEEYNLK